jgi:hypothetical protein
VASRRLCASGGKSVPPPRGPKPIRAFGVGGSDAPSEDERRAQDRLAKAAYCKWLLGVTTDKDLHAFYAKLSVEWEKEATELAAAK